MQKKDRVGVNEEIETGSVLRQLKGIYEDLYNKNGKKRVPLGGEIGRIGLDDERLKRLYRLCELAVSPENIDKYTITYIKDRYVTYRAVYRIHLNDGEEIEECTVSSRIQYGRVKLDRQINRNLIGRILKNGDLKLIDAELDKLEVLSLDSRLSKRILDGIALDFPKVYGTGKITDKQWSDLIATISPYFIGTRKYVVESIDEDALKYFINLTRGMVKNGKDAKRLEYLIKATQNEGDDLNDNG